MFLMTQLFVIIFGSEWNGNTLLAFYPYDDIMFFFKNPKSYWVTGLFRCVTKTGSSLQTKQFFTVWFVSGLRSFSLPNYWLFLNSISKRKLKIYASVTNSLIFHKRRVHILFVYFTFWWHHQKVEAENIYFLSWSHIIAA